MKKYNGIYFVDEDYTFQRDLKRVCALNNINLDIEIEFTKLLSRIVTEKPDILFLSLNEYQKSQKYLQVFREKSPFEIPMIFIVGRIQPDFSLNLPSNYYYIFWEEVADFISKITKKLYAVKCDDDVYTKITTNYCEQIFKSLQDLGFNGSTSGTRFIRDCANEIMLNKCRPSTFSNSIYSRVAINYNTTTASVARCMKVSIDTAWKRRNRNKIAHPSRVTFEDFSKCPSAKEFVYYLANKLYNFNQESNFRKISLNYIE